MNNLYQPIRFKRSKSAKWERGFLRINNTTEIFLEEDLETIVNQVYKYDVDWGI